MPLIVSVVTRTCKQASTSGTVEACLHVLVTTDTMSGIWTYTRELVSGLVSRGTRVTLVSFGEVPLPEQITWMNNLHGLEYRPTAFRLDWMQEGEQDLDDSSDYLVNLVEELKPDLLHLNQMCYGSLPVDLPRVVVAHGDLISWWKVVHGREPKESRWLKWYRRGSLEGPAQGRLKRGPTRMVPHLRPSLFTQPK